MKFKEIASVYISYVQPKCLTEPKIMSQSSWVAHIERITFILANQSYWKHSNTNCNGNDLWYF